MEKKRNFSMELKTLALEVQINHLVLFGSLKSEKINKLLYCYELLL